MGEHKKQMPSSKEQHTLSDALYDTGVRCARCGTRLYVSQEGAALVLASLHRTGMAGLHCLCGHTHLVGMEILL
jgi:hypothetical protein